MEMRTRRYGASSSDRSANSLNDLSKLLLYYIHAYVDNQKTILQQ